MQARHHAHAGEPRGSGLFPSADRSRVCTADLAGAVEDSEEDKKNMAEMKEHEKKDFEWSDKDKSGKLSFEEVVRGQMSPGPEDITHSNHEEEMAEVDADKDNHVSLSEHLKNIDPELGEEEKSSMSEEDMKLHKESVASATVRRAACAAVARLLRPQCVMRPQETMSFAATNTQRRPAGGGEDALHEGR